MHGLAARPPHPIPLPPKRPKRGERESRAERLNSLTGAMLPNDRKPLPRSVPDRLELLRAVVAGLVPATSLGEALSIHKRSGGTSPATNR
jgi:hypothetical protein